MRLQQSLNGRRRVKTISFIQWNIEKRILSISKVEYTCTEKKGTEYLRLSFKPAKVTINGNKISLHTDLKEEGYTLKNLENGDYVVTINRLTAGKVMVTGSLN